MNLATNHRAQRRDRTNVCMCHLDHLLQLPWAHCRRVPPTEAARPKLIFLRMSSIAARVKISSSQLRRARKQSKPTPILRRLCHPASRREHTFGIPHWHSGVFPPTNSHSILRLIEPFGRPALARRRRRRSATPVRLTEILRSARFRCYIHAASRDSGSALSALIPIRTLLPVSVCAFSSACHVRASIGLSSAARVRTDLCCLFLSGPWAYLRAELVLHRRLTETRRRRDLVQRGLHIKRVYLDNNDVRTQPRTYRSPIQINVFPAVRVLARALRIFRQEDTYS